ncbi:MAG: GIY-YIG nuclease family protein [Ignavibacteriales bacterium]|nr:GIY-YIG nuclease family protein [Ignavibacteriales bacterium]
MYWVYVLRSIKDLKLYIGFTDDLPKRMKKHQAGGVSSTKHRRPLVSVYQEKCSTRVEARKREKFLKSGPGHDYLRKVLGE